VSPHPERRTIDRTRLRDDPERRMTERIDSRDDPEHRPADPARRPREIAAASRGSENAPR
jgi:hypothetical protein